MSLNGTVWAPIGPSPIDQGAILANGQVTAIAIHPTNPNIIYIGTAWGGVWLTRDGGDNWQPIFDRAPALGIGEPGGIAIDPIDPSIIYVGTSNRDGSQFSRESTQPPAGLFKSTDGGGSWIRLGADYPASAPSNANQFFIQIINVVIVDPANHLVVYLASTSGVFVSRDGGLNWTRGSIPGGDVRSLVLDVTSSAAARVLYAGVTGVGVFRSSDGGQNWTLILSGSTAVVANELCPAPPCIPARSVGKFIVALAPPTSPPAATGIQVLYVTIEGRPLNRPRLPTDAPDPIGVFMSIDHGATWTRQTPAGAGIPPGTGMPLNTQGGYSFHMAVDPASPGDGLHDIIYLGAVRQAKSVDSGATFVALNGLHADTHAWAFAPQPGPFSVVYCGNDGGIYRCVGPTAADPAGVNFVSRNAGTLQTALFYNLDVKPDASASVTLGALQDNGIVTTAGVAAPTWKDRAGGDGFDVVHDGQNATQAYGRSNDVILRSTNDGGSWGPISPPWPASEAGVFLAAVAADPSSAGGVYVSSRINLWQSRNGGATWPKKVSIPGAATDVDVAATNGNNVAVAVGGQVLVSTDALGAYGLTDITRNLPGRFVGRVAFDPNDPGTLYAVLGGFSGFPGGHLFRTTLAGSTWTDISPPLDLPFNALALDGGQSPSGIYAGTDFGVLRSVDGGANWNVLDDLHFPRAPVFDLVFHAGELRAATFGRGVFAFVKPSGPSIAVGLEDSLAFGTVCDGPNFLKIDVSNVGVADLIISSVQRLMGSTDFSVLPTPATPLSLAPGENIGFTVAFTPTGAPGVEAATIRIITNDPGAPVVDLLATGSRGTARLATAIAHAGEFGPVCLGSIRDEALTLNNTGTCRLLVSNITSLSPDFLVPLVASYPLVIDPGDALEVTLRFAPMALGLRSGTVQLFSNDPASPQSLEVSGLAPPPRLALVMADSGSFGQCCVGSFKDEPLILSNSGLCTLSVTGVSSSSGEFVVPEVLSYPLTIEPGNALEVPIRFQPASLGAKTATITVTSDDPANPHTIDVSGDAPPGQLAVTGSTYFGGVKCGHRAYRAIAVCNVGDCDLHVSKVAFKHKSRHWALVHNPFPATLHPGSCLNVTIRYKATQSEPRPCELVIRSDDPMMPVRKVEIIAWTRCCCQECCEACRDHRDCEERHKERCEEHHRRCYEEREEQGHVDRREDRRHESHGHHAKRHDEYEDEE